MDIWISGGGWVTQEVWRMGDGSVHNPLPRNAAKMHLAKEVQLEGGLGYLGDGDFILKKIKRRLTEVKIFAQLRI